MRKLIVIPRRNLYIRKDTGTIAIRGLSGRFKGRRGPNSNTPYKGIGDTTRAQHLPRDFDLDKDGRIESFERGGTIHGRDERMPTKTKLRGITIPVKGSRARGHLRRTLD